MSDSPKQEEQLTPEKGKSDPPIKPKNSKSVAVYLVILFAAAFVLLLMAYFMQQRSNNEVIGNLQNSMNQFQTVDELRDENQQLRKDLEALEKELDELTELYDAEKAELEHYVEQNQILMDNNAYYEDLIDSLLNAGVLTRNEDGSLVPNVPPEIDPEN